MAYQGFRVVWDCKTKHNDLTVFESMIQKPWGVRVKHLPGGPIIIITLVLISVKTTTVKIKDFYLVLFGFIFVLHCFTINVKQHYSQIINLIFLVLLP